MPRWQGTRPPPPHKKENAANLRAVPPPPQIYEGGRGLGFHLDKDEHAMATEGRMVCPIHSSVLYLTGGEEPATGGVRQARGRAGGAPRAGGGAGNGRAPAV